MFKVAGTSAIDARAIVAVGLIALLAFAGLLLIRQHSPVAAQPGQSVHSVKAVHASVSSSTGSVDESSSPADTSAGQNSSQTNLSVNGQDISIPDNGEVHQTLTDGNTTTTIDAQTTSSSVNNGQASNSNSSNVNVHVSSDSSGTFSNDDILHYGYNEEASQ